MSAPPFDIGTCLFEDRLSQMAGARLFQRPVGLIEARRLGDVGDAFERIAAAQAEGKYLAGYVSYEAGYALEPKLLARGHPIDAALPLLHFWIFDECASLDPTEADTAIGTAAQTGHRLSTPRPTLARADYLAKAETVLDLIRAGDIYQANLTFPLSATLTGDPLSLYAALRAAQPVSYGAVLRMEEADILSLSPELFIERKGARLVTRPMKGTTQRGATPEADETARRALPADPKERAENLMIVDLLRNDLSRVCRPGTVKVPALFSVETYPTLHTMTSTVEGEAVEGMSAADVMRALFPCGSVTGAPKIRAQEILADLESVPRGPYTGAIGYLLPGGDFQFNVAIRTLTVHRDGRVIYPVGGGIVADSSPAREYDECLLKARVLTEEAQPFELIETMAWRRGEGFALLDRHLDRLGASAAWFQMPFDPSHTVAALDSAVANAQSDALRVRLTLDVEGTLSVTVAPLPRSTPRLQFVLSESAVDAGNPYLRHKTTRRGAYEDELARQKRLRGVDEVVFVNQCGALTEGTWTNLFLEMEGQLLTPRTEAGLLPGTLRAQLLEEGKAVEAELIPHDLETADAIYLGNSVRGLMQAQLIKDAVSPGQLEPAT